MSDAADAARDPRVYMAAEHTFLAWIRTGLALTGFGFVVARYGLFLREARRRAGRDTAGRRGRATSATGW